MREWMKPVLIYGLTVDVDYSFADTARCLTLFVYHEFGPEERIPVDLWKLYANMLFQVGGDKEEFGPAFDDISAAVICLQVFISKDPHTLQTVAPLSENSYAFEEK
jgi:hypothetical protein